MPKRGMYCFQFPQSSMSCWVFNLVMGSKEMVVFPGMLEGPCVGIPTTEPQKTLFGKETLNFVRVYQLLLGLGV